MNEFLSTPYLTFYNNFPRVPPYYQDSPHFIPISFPFPFPFKIKADKTFPFPNFMFIPKSDNKINSKSGKAIPVLENFGTVRKFAYVNSPIEQRTHFGDLRMTLFSHMTVIYPINVDVCRPPPSSVFHAKPRQTEIP